MQLRPAAFAAYSALSAPRRSSALVRPCSGDVAMPMERVGGEGQNQKGQRAKEHVPLADVVVRWRTIERGQVRHRRPRAPILDRDRMEWSNERKYACPSLLPD